MIFVNGNQQGAEALAIQIETTNADIVGVLRRLKTAYIDFQKVAEVMHINALSLIDIEQETSSSKPVFICKNINGKQMYLYFDQEVKRIRKVNGLIETEKMSVSDWR